MICPFPAICRSSSVAPIPSFCQGKRTHSHNVRCIASQSDSPFMVIPFQARPVAQLDLGNRGIIGDGKDGLFEWLGEATGPTLHTREPLKIGRRDVISAGRVSEPPGHNKLNGVIVSTREVCRRCIDHCLYEHVSECQSWRGFGLQENQRKSSVSGCIPWNRSGS